MSKICVNQKKIKFPSKKKLNFPPKKPNINNKFTYLFQVPVPFNLAMAGNGNLMAAASNGNMVILPPGAAAAAAAAAATSASAHPAQFGGHQYGGLQHPQQQQPQHQQPPPPPCQVGIFWFTIICLEMEFQFHEIKNLFFFFMKLRNFNFTPLFAVGMVQTNFFQLSLTIQFHKGFSPIESHWLSKKSAHLVLI